MLGQRLVQLPQYHARPHPHPAVFDVQGHLAVEPAGAVHNDTLANGLAALAGAAAARQDGDALFARQGQDGLNVGDGLGPNYADGLDLVDGGVGGIAPTLESIEQYIALDLAPQALGQAAVADAFAGL